MTEEQMDQFESDMLMEDVDIIIEDVRQSIIDEKINELITYYGLAPKLEQILSDDC